MTETRFRNARLPDRGTVDITIRDGLFAAFDAHGGTDDEDLGGKLVLPGLIDGHIHLDKTFLGLPWRPHRAGPTVPHRIAAEKDGRSDLALSVEQRARNFLAREAANGTVALRSHVDIDPESKLDHLHQVLAAREAFAGIVDVQLVAFPQSGVLIAPGVAELLDAALSEGAELIGGIDPVGIEGDMEGHLDVIFGLAEKHGVGVDIHLHDPGHRGALELRAVAERTAALGMQGKVTVSHAFALATVDDRTLDLTIADLRDADVAILTSAPGTGYLIPVVKLREAGVRVFAGSDNVRDAWSPFGNGDMLERAMLVAYRAGLRTDEGIALAFDLCAGAAAQAIGYGPYGLEIGARADFVAVAAETLAEAVVDRPMRALVVKGGRVTARDGAVV
ncbi:amidohydrolase family protein [Thalassobaculum litoreum]|uniref:Cytosine deaminase n=1 Tax=Thalassobaculum litoreum DSM 18839 TaxID=1123362 RepID=A0A8G2BH47_9PROT|nr:amidohydrolase family protein [Thalassobaculum litoreum]SDF54523.1 cytosine deaminase [Thalassobaculum litoreum DSM 18839]